MIKELHFKNWKSFREATLYIDPLTILIGKNSSGKSNAIEAFSFLQEILKGRPISEVVANIRGGWNGLFYFGESTCSLSVVLENEVSDEYTYCIVLSQTEKGVEIMEERLSQTVNNTSKTLFYTDANKSNLSSVAVNIGTRKQPLELNRSTAALFQIETLPIDKEIKEAIKSVNGYIRRIFILNPNPDAMRTYIPYADYLSSDGANIAGVLANMEDLKRKDIEEKLALYVNPLPEQDIKKVWAITAGLDGHKDALLCCEEQWHGQHATSVDARRMSDGTLRFLAIVMALLTLRPHSLLIIEEVDNGLHPSRSHDLISLLKRIGDERDIDILCTTHNPVLIDALGVEMLPFITYVKRGENGDSELQLLEEKGNLAKLMSSASVGELMTQDKI